PIGHKKLLDIRFIETVEGNLLSIGRPVPRLGKAELLLIYPIGSAVYDLVKFSIGRNSLLFTGFQIYPIQVIILNISSLVTRGRELRILFFLFGVTKLLSFTGLKIIDKIMLAGTSSPDCFHIGFYQELALVSRQLIIPDDDRPVTAGNFQVRC